MSCGKRHHKNRQIVGDVVSCPYMQFRPFGALKNEIPLSPGFAPGVIGIGPRCGRGGG
jgi:hypothetical protein